MKVNEIFSSIQGEGLLVGKPMNFIRFTECNLSCSWCDTRFQEGKELNMEEIIGALDPKKAWVSLTGGEPLLEEDLERLIDALHEKGYRVLVETNATIYKPEVFEKTDFVSADIKPPSSKNSTWSQKTIDYCFRNPEKSQIKIVVQDQEDMRFFEGIYREEYPNWILQPEHSQLGELDYDGLVKRMQDNIRVIPQVHKILKVR